MKLNLGCGSLKLKDCINADVEASCNPDIQLTMLGALPFKDESFEVVYLFHTIEHVEKRWHMPILQEIRRILKPEGYVVITFPEFSKIIENWKNNVRGQRSYWEANIYGLQRYKSDYHVSLMDSKDFCNFLKTVGYDTIVCKPEPKDNWNTIVKAYRDGEVMDTVEKIIYDEVFASK